MATRSMFRRSRWQSPQCSFCCDRLLPEADRKTHLRIYLFFTDGQSLCALPVSLRSPGRSPFDILRRQLRKMSMRRIILAMRLAPALFVPICFAILAASAPARPPQATGAAAISAAPAAHSNDAKRNLEVGDYFRIQEVQGAQISPEGKWVAYTVETHDSKSDKSKTRIWMVPAAGGDAVPLTAESASSSHPRWSPDGKYLAFLSARDEEESGDTDSGAKSQ